jgi:hypothetical protein
VTKGNIARAVEIGDRPYVAYGGDLTAGFTPTQQQAFDYGLSGIGQQAPNYQAAQQAARAAELADARARLAGDVLALGEIYIDNNEQRGQAARKQVSAGIAWEMNPTTTFDLMLTGGMSSSVPDVGVKLGLRATM